MNWDKTNSRFATLAWINLGAGIATVFIDGGAAFGVIVTLGIALPFAPAGIFAAIVLEPFIRYEAIFAVSIAAFFIFIATRKFRSVVALIIIGFVSVLISYAIFVPLFTNKWDNVLKVAVEQNGFECIFYKQSARHILNTRKEKPEFEYAVAIKNGASYYWSFTEENFVFHSKLRKSLNYRAGVTPSCQTD